MIIDPFLNNPKTLYFKKFMSDSFMHNHQSALDNQREDDAIKDLQDSGIYPDPDEDNFPPETYDDYEPTDEEMMASFGTMWHDWL